MRCPQCGAGNAGGAIDCFYCGRSLSLPQAALSAAPIAGRRRDESWRLAVSFLMGGLYAPFGGLYLARADEWRSGAKNSPLPPAPPSQNGLIVLLLFAAVPALVILVFGFAISMGDVREIAFDSQTPIFDRYYGIRAAHRFGWMNCILAGVYPAIACVGAHINRRYRRLAARVHGDSIADHVVVSSVHALLVAAFALLPLLVVSTASVIMRARGWVEWLGPIGAIYMFACAAAALSVSWYCIRPAMRYAQVP